MKLITRFPQTKTMLLDEDYSWL